MGVLQKEHFDGQAANQVHNVCHMAVAWLTCPSPCALCRVCKAVLETPPGRDCFGVVDVFPDRLVVRGVDTFGSGEWCIGGGEVVRRRQQQQQQQSGIAAHRQQQQGPLRVPRAGDE